MDATQLYRKEIRAYPLLTVDEEMCLAKRVGQGDEAARKRMIECNLRLVVKIARVYCNDEVQLNDLIQEGNLGLMDAVENFRPEKGVRFSTYAVYWIKYAIGEFVREQENIISVSDGIVKEMKVCLRTIGELTKTLQREPTAKEIAKFMDKSIEDVRSLLNLYDSLQLVELPSEYNHNVPFVESLTDNKPDHVEGVSQKDMAEKSLEVLNDKQCEVITKSFGLRGHDETPLEAIGKSMGLTRQGAWKIQVHAIKKLRAHFAVTTSRLAKAA